MTDPTDDRPGRLAAWACALGGSLPHDRAVGLVAWLDAMLALNRELNLTAIRDPAQALVLHALDSLALARAGLEPRTVVDIGSGNGFPGAAAAALWPSARVTLVERTRKKAQALAQLALAAGFANVAVECLDAAQAPALRRELGHAFALATARAIGLPADVARLAAPLLTRQGTLVLWLDQEAQAPQKLASGLTLRAVLPYALPEPAARERKLAVYGRG